MAKKIFGKYKSPLNSFKEANEKMLGIIEPGRIRGFDTLFVQAGLTFGINHEITGIEKVLLDYTQKSPKTGVVMSKQGVVLHVEGTVNDLTCIANAGEEPREDIIYLDIKYLQDALNEDLGTFGVLPGGSEMPDYFVEIGRIIVQPGVTVLQPTDYTPTKVKSVGGFEFLSDTEVQGIITEGLANAVTISGTQTITGEKIFEILKAKSGARTFNVFQKLDKTKAGYLTNAGSTKFIEILNVSDSVAFPKGFIEVFYNRVDGSELPMDGFAKLRVSSIKGNAIMSAGLIECSSSAIYFPQFYFRHYGGRYLIYMSHMSTKNLIVNYNFDIYVDLGDVFTITTITDINSVAVVLDKPSTPLKGVVTLDIHKESSAVYNLWELIINNPRENLHYYGNFLKYLPGISHYKLYSTGNGLLDTGASFLAGIFMGPNTLAPTPGTRIIIQLSGPVSDYYGGGDYPIGILDHLTLPLGTPLNPLYTNEVLKAWGFRLNKGITATAGFLNYTDGAGVSNEGNILDSSVERWNALMPNAEFKRTQLANGMAQYHAEHMVIKSGDGPNADQLYLQNGIFEFIFDGSFWVEISRSIWF